jgi:Ni/Co efflux regulator RcnB
MSKVMVIVLAVVFAAAGLTTQKATAQETQEKEKTAAAAKEARWHGLIIRMDKDASTFDVRKDNVMKRIHYDKSTKWTEGTKYIDMSEFKEGNDVICFGTYDEKGEFHATRIDLHRR